MERPAWEPLEGETDYALFCTYRDAQPYRSIRTIAIEAGLTPTALDGIAAADRWHARREAYWRYLDRVSRETTEQTVRELAAAHARVWRSLREWIEETLADYQARGIKLAPKEIAAALEKAINGERLAQGQPTQRIDLSGASSEQLLELERQINAIEGKS